MPRLIALSPPLLLTKYNNYAQVGGDGRNFLALALIAVTPVPRPVMITLGSTR
jgi:hypothetical protein